MQRFRKLKSSLAVASLLGAGLLLRSPQEARADEFLLSGGGSMFGELLNHEESPRERYLVRTAEGGAIALDPSIVRRVIIQTPQEKEYEQRLVDLPDTVNAHWDMAEWCDEQGLRTQHTTHLERILSLMPDHLAAREILGYQQHLGRWMTQEEIYQNQGYIFHAGRWQLPQVVSLDVVTDHRGQIEGDWRRKLRMWRAWLDTPRRQQQGLEEIRAIEDPLASAALADGLAVLSEPRQLKMLYIDILKRLRTGIGVQAFINASLVDPDEEVRFACLEALEDYGQLTAVRTYLGYLDDDDFYKINLAAKGLAHLGDATVVRPLIDSLMTEHRVATGSGGNGQIGATFGEGSGGLTAGGGPQFREQQVQNRQVLAALTKLTDGVNFQYDEAAWKAWYAEEHTPENVDLRRGR